MHHKRKRPKKQRAGCLFCKYWKINHARRHAKWRFSERRKQEVAE